MKVSRSWDLAADPRYLRPFRQDTQGIREGSYGQFNPNTT